jgi:hypothetical protein
MIPDEHEQAAAGIAAALHAEPPEVQRAYRCLFARIALSAGAIELVGQEIRVSGVWLVCPEPQSGAFYSVDRPQEWIAEEEEQ